jgi:aquaporin Z
MNKYLTEFIGTFFLVLTIGLSVLGGSQFAPLAIGSVLAVMIYMGGHISGAHYNPAVTVAVALRGKCSWLNVIPYWVAQLLGAVVAALAVYWIRHEPLQVMPGQDYRMGEGLWIALVVEVLMTFALALVVLNVATANRTAGNSYFGFAIGFTVFVGAVSVGAISGGAFNPAVGLGPWIVHSIFNGKWEFSYVWIYAAGPLAGAILAALVFRLQSPEDFRG